MELSGACQVSSSDGRGCEEGMANEGNTTVKGHVVGSSAAMRSKPGRGSNRGKANNGRVERCPQWAGECASVQDRKLLIYRRLIAISQELNHGGIRAESFSECVRGIAADLAFSGTGT
jgi:hypothetical protein